MLNLEITYSGGSLAVALTSRSGAISAPQPHSAHSLTSAVVSNTNSLTVLSCSLPVSTKKKQHPLDGQINKV